MIKSYAYALLACAGLGLHLDASVPVPNDLHNPFEVPDPAGFKMAKSNASSKTDNATVSREAAFGRVKDKLYSLPVRGIISNMKNAASGDVTVLLGEYTIRSGTDLPMADFDIKGIIKIASVTPTEIVVNVSIDLETRKMTIPLAR
jgi:hypothetical protein